MIKPIATISIRTVSMMNGMAASVERVDPGFILSLRKTDEESNNIRVN